ncbi:inositol phospholipid biosynthesis protein Scs3, putative [Talaromyces stipitatus ATCC 10500]|uniref:Acyl-coenzyme A diphosphatase SCS3 n=1 Tax=Talaromyces stipitatus (strain ATCC 10500 / CBS 375.48 / QM 6759 / NRRL 1006) TaxID=441959 RepID=B8M5R8_TALSN|nr:inositol phospholipid biosynthesis protein Scs3, putative [Talaromyces stipitatus ATCC 10500]EED20045.1 inositol phospholipid biosynthesis protein Scs3, putative [Talaromyces stipitatus ATCC 10500]
MATSTAYPRSGSPSQTKRHTNAKTHPPATVLLIYPLTLILGSIYSVISPTARSSQNFGSSSSLTPTIATDINLPTSQRQHRPNPVNYFARKNNIFNLYFVKIGWVWITFAFLSLLLTRPYYTKAPGNLRGKRSVQALLRYAIVTCAWFLTTQWFFGPAIIDRTFVITGGKCERLPAAMANADDNTAWEDLKVVFTAAACKASGGLWKGGHDVSGHVFMLVLGSAFLALEVLGTSQSVSNGTAENSQVHDKCESDGEYTVVNEHSSTDPVARYSTKFVWVVIGLSWWMLFMTAIWFHTWLEKLSGLLISVSVVYITYFLPRSLPAWADIIGIPGFEPAVRIE